MKLKFDKLNKQFNVLNFKFGLKTLLITVLVFAVLISATFALLTSVSKPYKNNFLLPNVDTKIEEKFEDNQKKQVKVKNTGDIDTFVRVAVVANWQDDSGNVYKEGPVLGTDYKIQLNTTNWKKSGNYYYYKKALVPDATTENLLTSPIKPLTDAPDGYHLAVEIIDEAIEAVPTQAIKDAWHLNANDGAIVFD